VNLKTKLALRLPPEVSKIMPWIIAARATGCPKQIAWAQKEYEIATTRARAREQWERGRAEREENLRLEAEKRRALDAFWREFDSLRAAEWQREEREEKRWNNLGFPNALKEGFGEPQPAQSSQKGWRRLLSEHADLCNSKRYGQWGNSEGTFQLSKHTGLAKGRKPRKPWFK
jgi:hypothetical protein